jgi:hypothetical protein
MEKMTETAINLRKQIAMGMHEGMYKDGGKMEAKSGKKKPKKAKPPMGKKSGRRGY